MRIDVVTIFPDYLAPLELSLLGKARADGLIDLHTHDLRAFTHDRHHTTDDTPYGGGPGMVMKPEPWGEALDSLLALAPGSDDLVAITAHTSDRSGAPRLIVPTPSGSRFTQATAERLAEEEWLIFACGRYEGIDQRVVDHYSRRLPVEEISIGDYVLNGGEVAAMVIIESVSRLIPGFMGNPASLTEESHGTAVAAQLLEYPLYTKPPSWRGYDVPDVLLSGHHANIARWRLDQARRRTAHRRPDLLHGSETVQIADLGTVATLSLAQPADAAELMTLQRSCWVKEAQDNEMLRIPPLMESLEDVRRSLDDWSTYVLRAEQRLIGSVRARAEGSTWMIGRLMVALDLQGRGLGGWLLDFIERAAPDGIEAFELFTGARSTDNLLRYRKAGYRVIATDDPAPGVVRLSRRRR